MFLFYNIYEWQKDLKEGSMPETTENYHRVPVARKKKGNELRTITVSKGIKALYDIKRKIIVTYLFDVNNYTMKKAKKWVEKHKSSASHLQIVENLILVQRLNDMYTESKQEVLDSLNK